MKLNPRFLSVLLLACGVSLPVIRADEPPASPPPPSATDQGPPRPSPARMREHRMKMLDEKLQLTSDEKTKIAAIWDNADTQMKALRADDSLSREDRRTKAGDLMKGTHDQVRAVLTPDQQKIFDTLPPEGHGRRGPRPSTDKPADAPPPQS